MRGIAKGLVVAAELEPAGVEACAGGALVVAEGGAGVVGQELREGAGCGEVGAVVDGLGDVEREGVRRGLGVCELGDERDGDLGEASEALVCDVDGARRRGLGGSGGRAGRGVEAVDEGEDVAGPGELGGRVAGGVLDGGEGCGERGDGGEGRGERGRAVILCALEWGWWGGGDGEAAHGGGEGVVARHGACGRGVGLLGVLGR